MRRASTLILAAWTAACAGARVPGLPPDATAPIPAAPLPGRLSGAALGWTLGGEAHVFVTDSDFAREVYNTQDPAAKTTPLPRALARRRIVVIDADTVPGHARAAAPSAAMIASTDGAVPALLRLVRVHRGEDCGAAGPVVELVYAITPEALPAAPPAHAVVLALLDAPPSGISRRTPPAALSPADARRLIARLARQAARLAVRASDAQPGEPLVPLPALDPDQETDAGEVIALARRGGETILGVAFRIRFARGADTTLVSGVALTDARGASVRWLLAPVRGALQGGVVKSPGTRYVLRGSVARPGGGLPYLLVDQIADVAVSDARELALDPQGPALRAALPLALRCRAS